jgi:D-alanyl-D-alanine carboxypeptidase
VAKDPRRATRGLATRAVGVLLGVAVAAAIILPVGLSPALSERAVVSWHPANSNSTPLIFGAGMEEAVGVPSLGVHFGFHANRVVPIASLTKLMTAYVTIATLPLATGETGPCTTLTSTDVADYEAKASTDQSSIPVTSGESLCEDVLLRGLLVHSASNYADILARLISPDAENPVAALVAMMNHDAQVMGLSATHYADDSGFSPLSVSSANDQLRLASELMRNIVIRSMVDETGGTFPYAGFEGSFTPLVGVDGVIGVKSGRTSQAGGCDVMAMTIGQGHRSSLLYSVVLGARGGDLLTPAGQEALRLATSLKSGFSHVAIRKHQRLGWLIVGGRRVALESRSAHSFLWYGNAGAVRIVLKSEGHLPRANDVAGWLVVGRGSGERIALTTSRDVQPPTLWQRLR